MLTIRTLLLLVACAFLGLGADSVKLHTLTGKMVEGELVSISAKDIVLKGADGPVTTSLKDVLDLDLQAGPPAALDGKYKDVELTDGSLLHCSQFGLKDQEVTLKLAGSGQEIKLPLAALSYYLNDAQDPKVREEWQGLLSKKTNRDLLAIRDREGVVNPLDGTFGAGDDKGQTIEFEDGTGTKRRITLARIHALSFFRKPDTEGAEVLCKVSNTGGDLLVAAGVATTDAGLAITTQSGVKVEWPRPLIVRLDFSHGRLTFLSDLEPLKVTETSTVERVEHYRRDKNLDEGPLRLEKETYTKGLAVHATTELVYDIGGQYEKFKAVLGVDAGALADSHVKVTLDGDGRNHTFDVERKDGKVTVKDDGGDLPGGLAERPDANAADKKEGAREVRLDIKNVKQLRIVVASANLLDLGDQATLAEARVSK